MKAVVNSVAKQRKADVSVWLFLEQENNYGDVVARLEACICKNKMSIPFV